MWAELFSTLHSTIPASCYKKHVVDERCVDLFFNCNYNKLVSFKLTGLLYGVMDIYENLLYGRRTGQFKKV